MSQVWKGVLFKANVVPVWDTFWLGNGMFSANVCMEISLGWREEHSCNLAQGVPCNHVEYYVITIIYTHRSRMLTTYKMGAFIVSTT